MKAARRRILMVFVSAQPESLGAAASRLEAIGSGLAAQHAATETQPGYQRVWWVPGLKDAA
jgi:hypothetical protein